jgi:hypothetical protein
MIMVLDDVDLRIGRRSGSAANSNEKRKFHSGEIDNPRPFYNCALTVCQGFRAAQLWCKRNGIVIFVLADRSRPRDRGLSLSASACRVAPLFVSESAETCTRDACAT